MKEKRRERELEHLHRLLSRSLPGRRRSGSTGRTVQDEARETRRRVVTGSVIAVAVAALVVTPQFLNKSRTTDMRRHLADATAGSTASAATPAIDPTAVTPCPDRPVPLPTGGADGTAMLAEASSIRLCPAAIPGVDSDSVDAPRNALTTGATTFFRTVSGLPPADAHRCDAIRVIPRPYVYLVGFSDGSVDQVYVASSCDDVTVGGVPHPSDVVLRSYLQSLDQQRSAGATSGR